MATVVEQAQMLIAQGKKAEAQKLLEPYIQANLKDVEAWILEASTWPTSQSIKVLEMGLNHNPGDSRLQQALAQAKFPVSSSVRPPVAQSVVSIPVPRVQALPQSTPVVVPLAQADEVRKCPYCAETIRAEAIVCRYCGRDLQNLSRPVEVPVATSGAIGAILIVLLCFLGLFWIGVGLFQIGYGLAYGKVLPPMTAMGLLCTGPFNILVSGAQETGVFIA